MEKRHSSKWGKNRKFANNQYFQKDCNSLPQPIEHEDVKRIIKKIRGEPREKAMILVLLRTGMRICELLATKIQDIYLKESKILIFESAKYRIGRVVSFSEDARVALKKWMKIRDQKSDYLYLWPASPAVKLCGCTVRVQKIFRQSWFISKRIYASLSKAYICYRLIIGRNASRVVAIFNGAQQHCRDSKVCEINKFRLGERLFQCDARNRNGGYRWTQWK